MTGILFVAIGALVVLGSIVVWIAWTRSRTVHHLTLAFRNVSRDHTLKVTFTRADARDRWRRMWS